MCSHLHLKQNILLCGRSGWLASHSGATEGEKTRINSDSSLMLRATSEKQVGGCELYRQKLSEPGKFLSRPDNTRISHSTDFHRGGKKKIAGSFTSNLSRRLIVAHCFKDIFARVLCGYNSKVIWKFGAGQTLLSITFKGSQSGSRLCSTAQRYSFELMAERRIFTSQLSEPW